MRTISSHPRKIVISQREILKDSRTVRIFTTRIEWVRERNLEVLQTWWRNYASEHCLHEPLIYSSETILTNLANKLIPQCYQKQQTTSDGKSCQKFQRNRIIKHESYSPHQHLFARNSSIQEDL